MDGAALEPALVLGGLSLDDLDLALALVELGFAGLEALVRARLELLGEVVELGLAETEVALQLEEPAVRVAELCLAALEQLDPALDLALAGGELVAEGLFPFGDADPLDLELGGHALFAVARVVRGLDELLLELRDPRAGLVERGVAVVELLDELLHLPLGFRGAGAVALDVVQDLGELLPAIVGQVVDDVAGLADDVVLETVAQLRHGRYPKNRPRAEKL